MDLIDECLQKVIAGRPLDKEEATGLINVPDGSLDDLAAAADQITRRFSGGVDIEQLYNIKKNGCSEDCTFCAQSALYDTASERYRLPPAHEIVEGARKAKENGAGSYCLVAAWRQPSYGEFEQVCDIIAQIRDGVGIEIECSLGFLTEEQARRLKELGVKRYNHNLETARSKFAQICTTHTYQDRLDTLSIARDAGLELCTGGIIGMGETREQRLELALELQELAPEEVTINMLVPVPGTPLELQTPLADSEIVRMFALTRFLLPDSVIKISGGRETALPDSGARLLKGGADGIITEGYLTMGGNTARQDIEMIRKIGRKPGA